MPAKAVILWLHEAHTSQSRLLRSFFSLSLNSDEVADGDVHELHCETKKTHEKETGADSAHDAEVLPGIGLRALVEELSALVDEVSGGLERGTVVVRGGHDCLSWC